MSHQIQKDWMTKYRFSEEYRDGVRYFIQFAVKYGYSKTHCSCPCTLCRNKYTRRMEEVKLHLFTKGIDQMYRMWSFHGEKSTNMMIELSMGEHIQAENVPEQNTKDVGLGMGDFVDGAYGVYERASNDAFRDDTDHTRESEEPFAPEPDLGKRYDKYKVLAEEKLYPTCEGSETTLSAIVELHNMKKMFGWSGNSVTYLLSTLKRWLPKGNTLPNKYPIMKQMLKDLGMEAKCIHACQYHCILYYKEHENATICPVCGTPRYKVKEGKSGKKETTEPYKVLRYFPIGPRLKRLYTIPWIARDMTWHDRATVSPDSMRHLIDLAQWAAIKRKWPVFADEGRNVWLGIATDGFNPRGIQSCGYSCWPVIMVPYNLPPSLCMKSEFQMMTLLIPGPKAPGQDIDVFLQPLVDELKQLWENGVEAYDMHLNESFQMRAIVIVGIHDLPAFGNLSGYTVHGYFACPVCADNTQSIRLPHGNKIVYVNYRKFLPFNHPFRKGKFLGLRTTENEHNPNRLSGRQILAKLSKVTYKPGKFPKRSGTKRKRHVDDVDEDIEVNVEVDTNVEFGVDGGAVAMLLPRLFIRSPFFMISNFGLNFFYDIV